MANSVELNFLNIPENPVLQEKMNIIGEQILRKIDSEGKQLNLTLCDSDTICNLNREFRNLNKPTDVLSWSYYNANPPEKLLGEIAVCQEICTINACKNGWDFETECIRLFIHAVAHIVGYDHRTDEEEKQMLVFEKKLLNEIGYPNLYPSDSAETHPL